MRNSKIVISTSGGANNSATVAIAGSLSVGGAGSGINVGNSDTSKAEGKLTVGGMTTVGADSKFTINATGKFEANGGLTIENNASIVLAGGQTTVGAASDGIVTINKMAVLNLNGEGKLAAGEVKLVNGSSHLAIDTNSSPDISFKITGNGAVVVGSGLVTLNNDNNSFEGGVNLNGGTLIAQNINQLGGVNKALVRFFGGTLRTDSGLPDDNGLTLSPAGDDYKFEVAADTTFTINQVLSGSKGLSSGGAAGGGKLVLAGQNTYEGKTVLGENGVIHISDINNLGAGDGDKRTVSFSGNNATLEIAGATLTSDDQLVFEWAGVPAGITIVDPDNTFTLAQPIRNTDSSLRKKGAGTLVLADKTQSSTFKVLVIEEGTVSVLDKSSLGSAGSILFEGGFLDVGSNLTDSSELNLFLKLSNSSPPESGIFVGKEQKFSILSDFQGQGSGMNATFVKRGEGELVLQGTGGSIQTNNILEAGTLRVTSFGQLGTGQTMVTFRGGELAIGDGNAAAGLEDDTNLLWGWSGVGEKDSGAIFNIAHNSRFIVKGKLEYTGDQPRGVLVKRGDGILTLQGADIAYSGGTLIEGGVLRTVIDDGAFRFQDGIYGVAGGTLEANVSDLTITSLLGNATLEETIHGNVLKAGVIVLTNDVPDQERETTLTVKETLAYKGMEGFWGRIEGSLAGGLGGLGGTLVVDAETNKEVVLTGNKSYVGTVQVKGGTLRVNEGKILNSDGAFETFTGSLRSNSLSVNGTNADNRASLAGSGRVEANSISIGEYGTLRGDKPGTLSMEGSIELLNGATVELGNFKSHYNQAGSSDITNPYFLIKGNVSTAENGNTINLNDDAIDPGVYRIIAADHAITGGGFNLGSPGALLPLESLELVQTDENKNVDLHASTGRATLRFWNATPDENDTSVWSIVTNSWTNSRKGDAGLLNPTGEDSVMAVFGYTDFPQQNGTVNVRTQFLPGMDLRNRITHGMQFFTGGWTLQGDEIELKGGAAGTIYEGISTIHATTGDVFINSPLSGKAALRIAGAGNVMLGGVNSYSGGTEVEGGTLYVNQDSNLGAVNGKIKMSGGTLVLGSTFTKTARAIESRSTDDTINTIRMSNSTVEFTGGLTGGGTINLQQGHAIFSGDNMVNFGSGLINVNSDAALSVSGAGGYIRSANVDGTLYGVIGNTLGIKNLTLTETAQVKLSLPSSSVQNVPAFKGSSVALNGQITELNLPEGYSVGPNGSALYVFDYLDRLGTIGISQDVVSQYANSNFTFAGVAGGYIVLNSKGGSVPSENPTFNGDTQAVTSNWSESTFVTGQSWNNGTATFSGNGANVPIRVEGLVHLCGLVINGPNFTISDAGVPGKPGVFWLQSVTGGNSIDMSVASGASANIAIPLSGSNFVKSGEGLLTLSGSSGDYTGTATVQGGSLYVMSNFLNASVVVEKGQLRANGVIKKATVNAGGSVEGLYTPNTVSPVNIGTLVVNGGTLKPGNSPGTIRLGGLSQTGGAIEFEPGDMIQVLRNVGGTPNGQAIFSKDSNGAPVQLQLVNSRGYTFGNTYTFVTAQNGVTFTTPDAVRVLEVNNSRLFSGFRAEAVGTNGNFYMQRNRGFATEAWSLNQLAVAASLEASDINGRASVSPIYNAIASASVDEAFMVRSAFDQLSGELHPSAQAVLVDESRYLREATVNRTRAALKGNDKVPGQIVYAPQGVNLSIWGQGYGSWGKTDSTANSAKLDRSIGGFVLGFDSGIADNWRLGIAGGYAKSNINANSKLNKANVDNYNLAIYGGGQFGAFGLRMGAGYTWHRLDTSRQFAAFGLRDAMSAKYDARTMQIYGEAGYELKFDYVTIEPFLNLAYVHHNSDNVFERGLGLGAALNGSSNSMGTGFSTLGMRLSKDFDVNGVKGAITGTLGWRAAFGDVDSRWVFQGSSLPLFSTTGTPIAKNAAVLGVGIDLEIAKDTTLGVSYNGQISNHTQDHGVRGNFAIKF